MELPTSQIGTSASTLQIELHSPEHLDPAAVQMGDLVIQLNALSWLGGAVQAQATTETWHESPFEVRVLERQPEVIRAHYGSPLSVLLGIDDHVVADLSAIALLIFGLKRFWAIDLELRAHREEQRARFYEAQKRAGLAEYELAEAEREAEGKQIERIKELSDAAPEKPMDLFEKEREERAERYRDVSRKQEWHPDVIQGVVVNQPPKPWRDGEGVWQID